ncbi:Ferrochelatase, mitochondrial [Eumeta japonica]|uniref:Ferrochelatase n=1 Tax=Eumeta variegata TaxID=151549 RepID=A0A4C1UAN7_EUMVA|nr:Ferrochelatase, mitochondrial [Eumeta japonica]
MCWRAAPKYSRAARPALCVAPEHVTNGLCDVFSKLVGCLNLVGTESHMENVSAPHCRVAVNYVEDINQFGQKQLDSKQPREDYKELLELVQLFIANRNALLSPKLLILSNIKTCKTQAKSQSKSAKTAIVMLNMGGPQKVDQVGDYLHRIMTDRDMIQLPVQSRLGPWIAKRRTEEVQKKYMEIGGGSPIYKWTDLQGTLLCKALDEKLPKSAPHKHYIGFRYVHPFTEEALEEMERDGVERAVIFSQYPQYSCATSGSSFNTIADYYKNRSIPFNIQFSVIDRWPTHPLLAQVFAERIKEKLANFAEHIRNSVLIMFTAHSLPLKAVSRGDTYPHEVAATVAATMTALNVPNPHRLVWQSKVGPLPWLEPYTDDAIKAYPKKGVKNMILVPIAFVNEHIETLHELDIEYCQDVAKKAGVQQIERAAAPNDHPTFIAAMADVVAKHMEHGPRLGQQFLTRCPHCTSGRCYQSKEFFKKLCRAEHESVTHKVQDASSV